MEPSKFYVKTSMKQEIKERNSLFQSIPSLILDIIEENRKFKIKTTDNIYKVRFPPSVKLANYLHRIAKFTKLENSTLIIMLIYLDRLVSEYEMNITYKNVHRLLLTATVVAIKFNEDHFYSNDFYAKIGGITLQEMNQMEQYFCSKMEFNFFVEVKLFDRYSTYLKNY